jgi:hypothetical protein
MMIKELQQPNLTAQQLITERRSLAIETRGKDIME